MEKMDLEFEQMIKKTKRKKNLKMLGISFGTLLVAIALIAGGSYALYMEKAHKYDDQDTRMTYLATYTFPNLTIKNNRQGGYFEPNGLLGYTFDYTFSKHLGNYSVDWGEQHFTSKVTETFLSDVSPHNLNNYPSQKSLELFDPELKYMDENSWVETGGSKTVSANGGSRTAGSKGKYTKEVQLPNDLDKISKMKDAIVEVGISFTKPMTYKAVSEELPKSLTQEWAYLDDNKTPKNQEVTYSVGRVDSFHTYHEIVGVPLVTENYNRSFKGALNNFKQRTGQLTSEYAGESMRNLATINNYPIQSVLKAVKSTDANNVKLNGIVLSGRSKDFETLKGKDFVRAASLGASVAENPAVPYEPNAVYHQEVN
jgi:hypothetical protein